MSQQRFFAPNHYICQPYFNTSAANLKRFFVPDYGSIRTFPSIQGCGKKQQIHLSVNQRPLDSSQITQSKTTDRNQ